MLTNIDAVIFDLDGSLVDSMWVWVEVDDDYMEKYHLTMPDDFHDAIEGMSYTETAQYFADTFPTLGLSVEEIKAEWLLMALHKYTHKVQLKAGAREFLRYGKARGLQFGIATSNTRELVDAVLEALQITDLFGFVCTACDVCAGKPAPDVYLKVADELNVAPQRCLVFEDIPNGILAGKNAEMTVCAVDDDFSRPLEKRKRELADYYIQSYHDVVNQTFERL